MKFSAILNTADGRITAGRSYQGQILLSPTGLFVVVYDNHKSWSIHDITMFRPTRAAE